VRGVAESQAVSRPAPLERKRISSPGTLIFLKFLEITLNNGIDSRSERKIGIETGDPRGFSSYEELCAAFRKQLHHFVEIKLRSNNVIERLYSDYMPAPFLSLRVDDCIASGKDYNKWRRALQHHLHHGSRARNLQ
jgi:pyruvate-formate lyase